MNVIVAVIYAHYGLNISLSHPHLLIPCVAMAGNIIPAIATTNAIIAGLIVLEGLKVLVGELGAARTVSVMECVQFHLCIYGNYRKTVISTFQIPKIKSADFHLHCH